MPGVVSWMLAIAALLSLVAFALLIVVALEVRDLIKQIKNEVLPVIDTAQQTVKTMQGTSEFVTKGLVKPLISGVSLSAGVAKSAQVLGSSLTHALRRQDKAKKVGG
jgi:hypothetical protein